MFKKWYEVKKNKNKKFQKKNFENQYLPTKLKFHKILRKMLSKKIQEISATK